MVERTLIKDILQKSIGGEAVIVCGWVRSRRESKGFGDSEPEKYPLQKKGHTLEFLREIGHLRPRTNTFGAVLRLRNILSAAVHEFFQSRGFLWVHTPTISGSDCEGAGELFSLLSL